MEADEKIPTFLPAERASKVLGVTTHTLRQWAAKGQIDFVTTPGMKFRYDVDGFRAKQKADRDQIKAALAKKLEEQQAARQARDQKRKAAAGHQV